MTVITNLPEVIEVGETVFAGEKSVPLTVRSLRWQNADMLIAFEEYATREEVGVLRNQMLYMKEEAFPPLPEGEFYHHQLIDLQVITDQGQHLGTLVEILETGANDVYVVREKGGKDLLLPATEEVILDVDFQEGVMLVHLLPGLI